MSTGKPDERLDQIRDRIEALEARAKAAGAGAKASMKHEVDALRRHEASARAALRERHHPSSSEVRGRTGLTDDEYLQLERTVVAAENELAAEIAQIARRPGDPASR
jgi:predicted  nucleic acid-binding Zn-ribbon protein